MPELQLEVTLDELTEFFTIFVAHVHEFDALPSGPMLRTTAVEVDLAKAGANFEFDGVAHSELPGDSR